MSVYKNTKSPSKVGGSHGACVNQWIRERELDNQPQPILEHTQRYYQRLKNQTLTNRAAELLRSRENNLKS